MKTLLTTIALVAVTATGAFAKPVTIEECISVYAPDSADGGSFELFSRSVMEEVAECAIEAGRYQESKDIRDAISEYNEADAVHFWIDGTNSFLDRVYSEDDGSSEVINELEAEVNTLESKVESYRRIAKHVTGWVKDYGPQKWIATQASNMLDGQL